MRLSKVLAGNLLKKKKEEEEEKKKKKVPKRGNKHSKLL